MPDGHTLCGREYWEEVRSGVLGEHAAIDWSRIQPEDLHAFAALYGQNEMNLKAEEMYLQALRGYKKAWAAEHSSTLNTVNNLGILYKNQGKMAEAEDMLLRALRGKEKAWGPEHTSTLSTVNNLGNVYENQGKMAEAEDMLLQALRGYEEVVEKDHPTTRTITRNLQAVQARK